jgi:Uma2 family endonuclease
MSTAAARLKAARRHLTAPAPFRFTVEQYYRAAEIGALGENPRTELIEGEIIEMPPSSPEHSGHVASLNAELIRRLPRRYDVRCQLGVRMSDITEPEPDIAVVKARTDKYTKAHPAPADTLLLLEVSKTTLAYDLERKAGVYAKAGIPEYWVLDLKARRLHVFTGPTADGWRHHTILTPREQVQSLSVPELKLKVGELFV